LNEKESNGGFLLGIKKLFGRGPSKERKASACDDSPSKDVYLNTDLNLDPEIKAARSRS
jgi:hypothetical protein